MCYYNMLHHENTDKQSPNDSFDGLTFRDYVVCFICKQDGGFEHFRSDLDKYSEGLLPLLDDNLTTLDTSVKVYLEEWYQQAVEYICRVIQVMGDQVKYIIHAALMGEKDTFIDQQYEESQVKDTHRFYDCCNLFELDNQATSSKGSEERSSLTASVDSFLVDVATEIDMEKTPAPQHQPRQSLTLEKSPNGMSPIAESWSYTETNKFCEEWAKLMLEQDKTNPFLLRQVVENYKLKVIQDMNHLKRLIRQSEVDHYALFRSFIFLKTSKNGPVLLHHTMYGDHASQSQDSDKVLAALSYYIDEVKAFSR